MSSAGASRENRVEEIVRRYKRQRLKFFAVMYLLPGLGLVSILLFDWVLRLGAEWMAFRFWAVEGPIILWCLLIAVSGIGETPISARLDFWSRTAALRRRKSPKRKPGRNPEAV